MLPDNRRPMSDPAPGKSEPRYLAVARTLIREIEAGTLPVGGMLPTEMEICGRFGISRHTAREAVRRLTELGMVTRRAGIGTTIRSKPVEPRYTASISDPADLFAFTRQTRVQLVDEDRVLVRGEWLEILPGVEGQAWPRFTSLRFAKGNPEPISYTETLVHPDYEAIRDRIHKPGQTVYQLIEQLRGEKVAALRQDITCVALPRRMAALLHARAGSPALRVLRYYLGADDALLSVAINTYPQDRFRLTTRWQLDRKQVLGR